MKWVLVGIVGLAIFVATQMVTILVIQPIGALPEGRTIVMSRMNTMNFIDSADAWCDRHMKGVSILCRITVLGRAVNEGTIIARLPYSRWLYLYSTGGKEWVN